MKPNWVLLAVAAAIMSGCIVSKVTQEEVQAAAQQLDFGNYESVTLATKAWDSQAAADFPATLAYTQKCVELYGERGKAMNEQLDAYAPIERVNNYWALNDAGTCMFIMATTYEKLRMYPEAAQAFRTLADGYKYAQCWDPRGWYWYPASGAAAKAEKYASR